MVGVRTASPARYGIVGSGWRTGFFLRLAQAMPERFTVTGVVTRTAERGDEVEKAWNVPTFRTAKDLVAADRPDSVIVSVPWEAAPATTVQLVELDIPVHRDDPPPRPPVPPGFEPSDRAEPGRWEGDIVIGRDHGSATPSPDQGKMTWTSGPTET